MTKTAGRHPTIRAIRTAATIVIALILLAATACSSQQTPERGPQDRFPYLKDSTLESIQRGDRYIILSHTLHASSLQMKINELHKRGYTLIPGGVVAGRYSLFATLERTQPDGKPTAGAAPTRPSTTTPEDRG